MSVDPLSLEHGMRRRRRKRMLIAGAFLALGLALAGIYAAAISSTPVTAGAGADDPAGSVAADASTAGTGSGLPAPVDGPGFAIGFRGHWGTISNGAGATATSTDGVVATIDLGDTKYGGGRTFALGTFLFNGSAISGSGWRDLNLQFVAARDTDANPGCTDGDLTGTSAVQVRMVIERDDAQASWSQLAGASDITGGTGDAASVYCIGVLNCTGGNNICNSATGTFVRRESPGIVPTNPSFIVSVEQLTGSAPV